MSVLFINGAFREGSRTKRLALEYLKRRAVDMKDVMEIDLGASNPPYLDAEKLRIYSQSVADAVYTDPMFDIPKTFAEADEILIAAPFWNFSIPAVLHAYLELVCTQGITFDMNPDGSYKKCCKASRLTFVCTAGGPIPEDDHTFAYLKTLNDNFWGIPEMKYIYADRLDVWGTDVDAALEHALSEH